MSKGDDLNGKHVTVMGLGRFGGGIGVARWLSSLGAAVTVTDQADAETLAESIRQLSDLDIEFQLGGHDMALLANTDLLVVSPAVNKDKSKFFSQATMRQIPWTSEMNLFFSRCPGRIVGVTGTVGKSTTTAMIEDVLRTAIEFMPESDRPDVWMGGNIGCSLLDELPKIKPRDIVVLELSSFQLEDLAGLQLSPSVAVMTSLKPNHLDRHGTFENYALAKCGIFEYQDPAKDHAIVCGEDGLAVQAASEALSEPKGLWLYGLDEDCSPTVLQMGSRTGDSQETRIKTWEDLELDLPGLHNRLNAAAAFAVGLALDLPAETWDEALSNFCGLPHRLQFVAQADGVDYYNDSKSTTPEAAITALESFDVPAVILLGGYDKKATYDALAECVAKHARGAVCYGATGKKIHQAIDAKLDSDSDLVVFDADTFEEAVGMARNTAAPGDVVVLSPACASWDMFTNYEARGEAFCEMVREWAD